jgi:hypothetical protein
MLRFRGNGAQKEEQQGYGNSHTQRPSTFNERVRASIGRSRKFLV